MRRFVSAPAAALGIAAGLGLATAAGAQTVPGALGYSNLVVFGDSLVDSGNARAGRLAGGGEDPAPPALGYFQGRFSNGFNFADYLALDLFGSPATASFAGGLNFSVGGAQVAEIAGDGSPSFLEQIGAFDLSGRMIDPTSLVLVTLGGNDVRREIARAAVPGTVPNFDLTLSTLALGLNELIDRGARNIIVTGLPDVGNIPAVTQLGIPGLPAVGTALSFNLNQAFGATVSNLATQTGVNLQFFDFFAFQQAINANPSAFGLPDPLNMAQACLQVSGAAPVCDGFVFFDPIHPTTQIHRAVADGLVSQLQAAGAIPEPATWAMMIAGFGAVGTMLRRRRPALAAA